MMPGVGMAGTEPMYSAVATEDPGNVRNSNVQDGFCGGSNLSQEEMKIRLGMAKSIDILGGMEHFGVCAVEKSSVYGASIALPQIARSAGYPKSMLCLAFRAYLFVLLNYFAQTAFVYYIYDSQININPFGSQMHLCDFSAHIQTCKDDIDAPGCLGPGGSRTPDPGSLYPIDIWITRGFVRDALKTLFPDRKDEIEANVVPGEYGVESYYCRLLCIFVFVLQIADEFQNIRDVISLLWNIPSEEASWLEYEPPARDSHGLGELEHIRFKVNGMPIRWKIINVLFVLIPRIFIWRMLTMAGVHFLMETAAMVDQIVNTTALSFVLTTDELILERLGTKATRFIVSGVQDYQLFDDNSFSNANDDETLNRYFFQELAWCHGAAAFSLLPKRLFWTLALMVIFTAEYYWHNCIQTEDGSIVSKDVFLPLAAHLEVSSFLKHFFSISENPSVDNSFWTMPSLA